MLEFVPYNQFNSVQFIAEGKCSKIYKATWTDGNIQSWNKENFKRSSLRNVVLRQICNSENITSEELNEVYIN